MHNYHDENNRDNEYVGNDDSNAYDDVNHDYYDYHGIVVYSCLSMQCKEKIQHCTAIQCSSRRYKHYTVWYGDKQMSLKKSDTRVQCRATSTER